MTASRSGAIVGGMDTIGDGTRHGCAGGEPSSVAFSPVKRRTMTQVLRLCHSTVSVSRSLLQVSPELQCAFVDVLLRSTLRPQAGRISASTLLLLEKATTSLIP